MSVVQIDAAKLDSYLREIKTQLQRHEDELLHPLWYNSIKPEIEKVLPLESCGTVYCGVDKLETIPS
jgi:GTP-sensing pleiotropic transcriptional regulator CodY